MEYKSLYNLLDSDLMKSLTNDQYKLIEDVVLNVLIPKAQQEVLEEISNLIICIKKEISQ